MGILGSLRGFGALCAAGRFGRTVFGVELGLPARLFGGFLAACTTHVGHYRYTRAAYDELAAWAESIGYHVSGISFQELIIGRSITDEEDNFITKIYLPLNVSAI